MKFYGKPKINKKEESRTCEYIRCDNCNKKIKKRYFTVMTSHNDWGNDSIYSFKIQDICEDCIKDFTLNYLKDISNTGKIEINSETILNGEYYGDYDLFEDCLVEEDIDK